MAEIVSVSDVILTHMARSIRKKSEQHILEVSVTLQMLASYNLEDVLKVVFHWPLMEFQHEKAQSSLLNKVIFVPSIGFDAIRGQCFCSFYSVDRNKLEISDVTLNVMLITNMGVSKEARFS